MDKTEFLNSVSVKYWMDSLNSKSGVHGTKYVWKHHLKRFCDWTGKTPDQLVAERKEDLKGDDKRVNHKAEMIVKGFMKHLETEGLSANTRKSYFMAVRNFYKRNYLELHFFRGDGPGNQTVMPGRRAASKEDIARMLEVCNPRVRALILFIKDTGLAQSDVARLKLKDLPVRTMEEIFTLTPPVPLVLNRKKTGCKTVTFIGQEGFGALKNTLRIRRRGSPLITIRRYGRKENRKGIKPEPLTLESPLFRSYDKFFAIHKGLVRHLSSHAICVIIRKAAILAEVWQPGFSAHALRRFFQTSLETSGMNANWIKKMMGHTLGGSEEPYSRPEIEMLRDAYLKSYPYLAVSEAVEQKSRVEALEQQMEALVLNGKKKDGEISQLKNERSQAEERNESINKRLEKMESLKQRIEQMEKRNEERFNIFYEAWKKNKEVIDTLDKR